MRYISTLGLRQAYNSKSPSRTRLIRNFQKKHHIHVIIYKSSSKSKNVKKKHDCCAYLATLANSRGLGYIYYRLIN